MQCCVWCLFLQTHAAVYILVREIERRKCHPSTVLVDFKESRQNKYMVWHLALPHAGRVQKVNRASWEADNRLPVVKHRLFFKCDPQKQILAGHKAFRRS